MSDLTIHEPTNCFACGYDLRGLRESGICPECGLHIRFTLEQRYSQRAIERENEEAEQDRLRHEKQVADFDRQTKHTDRINAKVAQQQQTAGRINAKMEEQAEHYDRILVRWDALQDRFEGVIAAMETMLRGGQET